MAELFLVLVVQKWSNQKIAGAFEGVPFAGIQGEPRCIGFAPVFDSREAAEAAWPGRMVVKVLKDETAGEE